jgi:hypothetical protein
MQNNNLVYLTVYTMILNFEREILCILCQQKRQIRQIYKIQNLHGSCPEICTFAFFLSLEYIVFCIANSHTSRQIIHYVLFWF